MPHNAKIVSQGPLKYTSAKVTIVNRKGHEKWNAIILNKWWRFACDSVQ